MDSSSSNFNLLITQLFPSVFCLFSSTVLERNSWLFSTSPTLEERAFTSLCIALIDDWILSSFSRRREIPFNLWNACTWWRNVIVRDVRLNVRLKVLLHMSRMRTCIKLWIHCRLVVMLLLCRDWTGTWMLKYARSRTRHSSLHVWRHIVFLTSLFGFSSFFLLRWFHWRHRTHPIETG